jgi:uridine kinase
MSKSEVNITIGENNYKFPVGITLIEVIQELPPQPVPIVAALVNHQLQELAYPLYANSTIQWIDLNYDSGIRIYKRSLNIVLTSAINELFPDRHLKIKHSLGKGTSCELKGEIKLTKQDVKKIDEKMRDLIAQDLPIIRHRVTKEDAIQFFLNQGHKEKADVLSYKPTPTVNLYTCGNRTDYYYGLMIPSTGILKYFELKYFYPGFIIRAPEIFNPTSLPPYQEHKKLAYIFFEIRRRKELLKIENIAHLNNMVKSGKENEIIQITETIHERHLHYISDLIYKDRKDVKLVLVAGPSSSGKTTFAQRLIIQFLVNGIRPVAISMDDYFVDRENTPKNEKGEYDFEDIHALDLKLFNEHLQALIAGEEVTIPKYSFVTGSRMAEGQKVKIGENQLLIIEGIHGLNEELTASIPKINKRKIYISALSQLNIDDHNPIPSSDARLIRRIMRDLQFRGSRVGNTMKMWPSVRRGEEKNIFPYQENADFIFDSSLIYELAILKNYVEPELATIPPGSMEYLEARRIMRYLQYILPISPDIIPLNSILREFWGGSCFV